MDNLIAIFSKKKFRKLVIEKLEEILREIKKKRIAKAILFTCVTLVPTKFWPKGVKTMQMTDIQTAVAHIAAVDAEGNPATLDSAPLWSSSDPSIVTVTPSADGMSAVIGSPSPAPLGSAVVTVTATVAGGDVSGTLAVDIIGSAATAINITTDAPKP